MSSRPQLKRRARNFTRWTAIVTLLGCIELAKSFPTKAKAQQALINHLRVYYSYDGPAGSRGFTAAMNWVAERDDRFDVQILDQASSLPHLNLRRVPRFIRGRGFVTITFNRSNTPGERFEAWAYQGPLDFEKAGPVRFGLGADPVSALAALDYHLGRRGSMRRQRLPRSLTPK